MPEEAARKAGRAEPDARRLPDGGEAAGTESRPIRVFVVEGHELFRRGLCDLLDQRGLEVVGDAADGQAACDAIPGLEADVVVMDLDLPGLSGIETTRRLARSAPRTRVVALAIGADEATVLQAIAAGVHGFLLKDAAATDMVSAVRAAAAGGAPISPRAAESLFERVRADAARLHPASDGGPGLTRRELEVLRLLTAGKSNAQIARELYISSLTVKHHISSIIRKLGVANRIQVAVRAVRDRIV